MQYSLWMLPEYSSNIGSIRTSKIYSGNIVGVLTDFFTQRVFSAHYIITVLMFSEQMF